MAFYVNYPEIRVGDTVYQRGQDIPDDAFSSDYQRTALLDAGMIVASAPPTAASAGPVVVPYDSATTPPSVTSVADDLLGVTDTPGTTTAVRPRDRASKAEWVEYGVATRLGSRDELESLSRDQIVERDAQRTSSSLPTL